jgi:hypothetical protein
MKNIDWNVIFKLKMFSDYFTNSDLIQLSLCCKISRKLLANSLRTFNFNSAAINNEYCSLLIKGEADKNGNKSGVYINPFKPLTSELNDSIKAFSNSLKLFKVSPINIVVNDYGRYHYLLNEIPRISPNIKKLVIRNSAFTMDTLQYLLDNFKCLENLELAENIIFYNGEFSNENTIKYPISLRSLKLELNGIMEIQENINPTIIKEYKYANRLHLFDITYQHLPNLLTFDYEADCDYLEESGVLFNFMKLNSQLESLRFSGFAFNLNLLNIIKDYKNLNHFELSCYIHPEDFEEYEMPVLHNIKHLYIQLSNDETDEMFINNFPNVEELVIENSGCITYIDSRLIQSFSNLKSLKFISIVKYNEYFTLPALNNLEKLEINFRYIGDNNDPIKLDVSSCNRLKLILYTKNAPYTTFKNTEENQKLVKNWNYLYFPHKLSFYKNG